MKYVAIHSGTKALYFSEKPPSDPGRNEVLVKVMAFGVNRADLLQREGKYPPPQGASEILGLECSGVIEKCGVGVKQWKVGDEVTGLVDGGAYAEFCVMDAGLIWTKPEEFSHAQAAAIPEVFLTAYQSLHWLGNIKEAESILIHAAASGVGLAAFQIAKLEEDIKIFGTASSGKVDFCKKTGYDYVIDYTSEDFSKIIETQTSGQGVDFILDFIGANYFNDNIKSLSEDGILVILAVLGGTKVEGINLLSILAKRLRIQGSTLRSRSLSYKRKLVSSFHHDLGKYFLKGTLKPIVYKELPWQEIELAHSIMSENRNIGKIILTVA